MREPTYLDALRSSWRLAWHHKNLWPFGLFALFLGQFGFLEILTNIWSVQNDQARSAWQTGQEIFSQTSWQELQILFSDNTAHWIWAVWLAIILLGLAISLLVVATVSQAALVYAGARYSRFRLSLPSESTAWHMGVRHFWRVLSLNIIRKAIIWGSALAVVTIAVRLTYYQSVWLWIGLVFSLILSVLTSIVTMYATAYVVVEETGLGRGLHAGLRLFLRHPVVSLEVGFITLLINVGFMTFGLLTLLYVFLLPNLIIKYFSIWVSVPVIGKVVGVISYGLFLSVTLAAGAVFAVFSITTWAYLYSKMHHEGLESRFMRLFRP